MANVSGLSLQYSRHALPVRSELIFALFRPAPPRLFLSWFIELLFQSGGHRTLNGRSSDKNLTSSNLSLIAAIVIVGIFHGDGKPWWWRVRPVDSYLKIWHLTSCRYVTCCLRKDESKPHLNSAANRN